MIINSNINDITIYKKIFSSTIDFYYIYNTEKYLKIVLRCNKKFHNIGDITKFIILPEKCNRTDTWEIRDFSNLEILKLNASLLDNKDINIVLPMNGNSNDIYIPANEIIEITDVKEKNKILDLAKIKMFLYSL